jgi:ABC-type Fe3+ transport system permease subunit
MIRWQQGCAAAVAMMMMMMVVLVLALLMWCARQTVQKKPLPGVEDRWAAAVLKHAIAHPSCRCHCL